MAEPEPEGLTLRDYLSVIWRRKWIIILVVLVATASAYYFADRQERQYSTSGTMFYKQQLDIENPLSGSYTNTCSLDREMATINDLMAGPVLQERAGDILKNNEKVSLEVGYAVSAAQQTSDSGSDSASNVVVVSGDSTDPELAAAAVNAYMDAFTEWDADQQRVQIEKAIPVVKNQLKKYDTKQERLTTDYIMLKQRLQDLEILEQTTSGNYRVLRPASVPVEPYAPNPTRSAILGFGVGLFAGIGLAFLLEQFDVRIRTQEQIARILRQPILGRVPRISRRLLGESALVSLRHPDGHVAEAFRMVRTNLDFMAVDADVTSIVVTSCMKGEGKSVTLANLAITMALAGKKVVVVDGDLRRPRMHKFFGLDNETGLSTVATGHSKLFSTLQPISLDPGPKGANGVDFEHWAKGTDARSRLYVLTSGPLPPNPGEIVASRRFAAILEELTTEADVVLVDSPAMLAVGDTSAIAARVDGLVFLVDMRMIKKPQLQTAADQLMRLPVKMLGTVVRMQHKRAGQYYAAPGYYYSYSYTEDGRERRRKRAAQVPATAVPAPPDDQPPVA